MSELPTSSPAAALAAIAFLTGVATICLGGAGLVALAARREREVARARTIEDAPRHANAPQGLRAQLFDGLRRIGDAASSGKVTASLRADLVRAGFHGRSTPAVYLGTKVFLLSLGTLVAAGALLPSGAPLGAKLCAVVFVPALLFFAPNIILAWRKSVRTREVQQRLPDAVDLLEICVSAGMAVDAAWKAVANESRRVSPVLADEMELTDLEVSLGVDRATAMRHMAQRTGADDISSLVALLVQAERFGSSIADALRIFARSLRQIQSTRAEEAAEKMAVKLLFPMVLFLFPALLLVLVGPAVIMFLKSI